MTVLERKTFLKHKIDSVTDEDILDEIENLIDNEEVFEFTPEQLEKIKLAQAQYARGEFLTDEEAQKQIDLWFAEQEK